MHASDDRVRERAEMSRLAARLASEYAAFLPADAVLSCFARCWEGLRRTGVSADQRLAAAEAMTRTELDQRIPPHAGPGPAQRGAR